MLVKFRTVGDKPLLLDSSEIYRDGDSNRREHTYYNRICMYQDGNKEYFVNDPTLAYLQNAWAHEGMRRVKRKDSKHGWINVNAPLVYPDQMTGYMIEYDDGSMDVEGFAYLTFIPYEMEEQKHE